MWPRKWMMGEIRRPEIFKWPLLCSPVMNWDRGQRGLLHRWEGHQYPVMCKQRQQMAEHHCPHNMVGSVWDVRTRSPCPTNFPTVAVLLSLLFVLINLRQFRRVILIRKKGKDICGDHKRFDLCRLNEVTYPALYEIIVCCMKSCFGNRIMALNWNEHGIKGRKNTHCQFYRALKYLCPQLAFLGVLLSVDRTGKLFLMRYMLSLKFTDLFSKNRKS